MVGNYDFMRMQRIRRHDGLLLRQPGRPSHFRPRKPGYARERAMLLEQLRNDTNCEAKRSMLVALVHVPRYLYCPTHSTQYSLGKLSQFQSIHCCHNHNQRKLIKIFTSSFSSSVVHPMSSEQVMETHHGSAAPPEWVASLRNSVQACTQTVDIEFQSTEGRFVESIAKGKNFVVTSTDA